MEQVVAEPSRIVQSVVAARRVVTVPVALDGRPVDAEHVGGPVRDGGRVAVAPRVEVA